MVAPILKQGDLLIVSIQSALTDQEFQELQDELVHRVGEHRSRGVIIDLTLVDVLDSFASKTLRAVADMVKLRGAETVLVGIQPDVAFTMVQLGLRMEGVRTGLDLEQGMRLLGREV
jgi:rsbT antagonist protein RsbS